MVEGLGWRYVAVNLIVRVVHLPYRSLKDLIPKQNAVDGILQVDASFVEWNVFSE